MSRVLTRSEVKALFQQASPDRPWLEWAALPVAIMIAFVLSNLTGLSGPAQSSTANPLPEGLERRDLRPGVPPAACRQHSRQGVWLYHQGAEVLPGLPTGIGCVCPPREQDVTAVGVHAKRGRLREILWNGNAAVLYPRDREHAGVVYITVDLAPWPRPSAVQPKATLGPAYGHEHEFRQQLADSVPMKEYGYTIKDLRFSKDYQKALVVFAHADSKARPRWEFTLTSDTFGRYCGMNMQPFYTPGTANTPGIYITVDLAGK